LFYLNTQRGVQSVSLGALPMLRAAMAPDVEGGEFCGPRFVTVGHPVRETPSRRARNTIDAERLWDVSAELTGGRRLRHPWKAATDHPRRLRHHKASPRPLSCQMPDSRCVIRGPRAGLFRLPESSGQPA